MYLKKKQINVQQLGIINGKKIRNKSERRA